MADNPWWDPRPTLNKIADHDQQRLNFIFRQVVDPCDAPLTVWAWYFWKALGKVALGLIAIDVKQMVRSTLRPQFSALKSRGIGHWKTTEKGERPGKKGKRWKFDNLDYNDLTGKELHNILDLEPVVITEGELFIWTIVDVFELAAFYYMIWTSVLDLAYYTSLGVAESKYCHARDDAVMLASAPGYPLLGIFGWDAVGVLDVVKQRHVQFFNGFGTALDFGPGYFAFNAIIDPGTTNAITVGVRCRCLTGPRTDLTNEVTYNIPPGGSSTAIGVQGLAFGGETWIAEIKVSDAVFVRGPTINMQAVGTAN